MTEDLTRKRIDFPEEYMEEAEILWENHKEFFSNGKTFKDFLEELKSAWQIKESVSEEDAGKLYDSVKEELPDNQPFEEFMYELEEFDTMMDEDLSFRDATEHNLLKEFICKKCGEKRRGYDKDEKRSSPWEPVCKFCTGKRIDPCKDCLGEDCGCCGKKINSYTCEV